MPYVLRANAEDEAHPNLTAEDIANYDIPTVGAVPAPTEAPAPVVVEDVAATPKPQRGRK